MPIQPRPFLTTLSLCLAPLLLLALINRWNNMRLAQNAETESAMAQLAVFSNAVDQTLSQQENDLLRVSQSAYFDRYLTSNLNATKAHLSPDTLPSKPTPNSNDLPVELKAEMLTLFNSSGHFEQIVCFDRGKQPLFTIEERYGTRGPDTLSIRTNNFLAGIPQPDDNVWTAQPGKVLRSKLTTASFGASQTLTVPVMREGNATSDTKAALVGQINVDAILAEGAKIVEAETSGAQSGSLVIVLDSSGKLVYHPNDAMRHQPVATAFPAFHSVASLMLTNQRGTKSFSLDNGNEYVAVFRPLPRIEAFAAVANNESTAMASARRSGMVGIFLFGAVGIILAIVLSSYKQRQNRGIDRVTEAVTAIAKGELDRRIDVSSGDEARVIADSINLMTERLREQLAREAEARQFDSFVRLSAMLTHDLKNAIEALSLIVGNMERHFDNEKFRSDAMRSLTLATEKLKGLVTRISHPVTTLSGEHRRPLPVDLARMLRRVTATIVDPASSRFQVELDLAGPVYALADAERIEKVMENLILNAVESMGESGGKLKIAAGVAEQGKVFFSVSDTGAGISAEFIEQRLFRPFATTKKNGVGLGLYTCREVVRANAGTIDVQSEKAVGTTFRVVLPSAPTEVRK